MLSDCRFYRNCLIPLIAVVAGLILTRFVANKAGAEGMVLEDERLKLIATRASDMAFRAVTVALAIFGFALKALNNALGEFCSTFVACY